jgi:hypothetical protein
MTCPAAPLAALLLTGCDSQIINHLRLNQFGRPDVDGLKDDAGWNAKAAVSFETG